MHPQRRGLQELVALLLREPALIDALEANSDEFAIEHNIDPAVARQLLDLSIERLRITAALITNKHHWRFRNAFPASVTLIDRLVREGGMFLAGMERVNLYSARDVQDFGHRLVRFAQEFPGATIAVALLELIRFEFLWWQLRSEHSNDTRIVCPGMPSLRHDAAIARFSLPIAKVHKQLLANGACSNVALETAFYVLSIHNGLQTRISRVSEEFYRVLACCNGMKTYHEIAEELSMHDDRVERLIRVACIKNLLVRT